MFKATTTPAALVEMHLLMRGHVTSKLESCIGQLDRSVGPDHTSAFAVEFLVDRARSLHRETEMMNLMLGAVRALHSASGIDGRSAKPTRRCRAA